MKTGPIPKKTLLKRLREERNAAGLKELKVWLRPEHIYEVKKFIANLP